MCVIDVCRVSMRIATKIYGTSQASDFNSIEIRICIWKKILAAGSAECYIFFVCTIFFFAVLYSFLVCSVLFSTVTEHCANLDVVEQTNFYKLSEYIVSSELAFKMKYIPFDFLSTSEQTFLQRSKCNVHKNHTTYIG